MPFNLKFLQSLKDDCERLLDLTHDFWIQSIRVDEDLVTLYELIYHLPQILSEGFTKKQLIHLLTQANGFEKLSALLKLILNQQKQLTNTHQSGLTAAHLIKILNQNNGVNDLNALLILLKQLMEAEQLDGEVDELNAIQKSAKLNREQIVKLLDKIEEPHHLQTFNELIRPTVYKIIPSYPKDYSFPYTAFTLLLETGFTATRLMRILDNEEGSHHLKIILRLLAPLAETKIQSNHLTSLQQKTKQFTERFIWILENIEDTHSNAVTILLNPLFDKRVALYNFPNTVLTYFLDNGFSTRELIEIINSYKMESLLQLTKPLLNSKKLPIFKRPNLPYMHLMFFFESGFTTHQLFKTLNHENGVENFHALIQLLNPTRVAGQYYFQNDFPATKLLFIYHAGFSTEQVFNLLNHHQGIENLNALIALINAGYIPCESESTRPTLRILHQKGFSKEHIALILNHNTGASNLEALLKLLQPPAHAQNLSHMDKEAQPLTLLAMIQYIGLTTEPLIQILNYKKGAANVEALIHLLQPLTHSKKHRFQEQDTPSLTAFIILQKTGLTVEHLIRILNHEEGAEHLNTLMQIAKPLLDMEMQPDLVPENLIFNQQAQSTIEQFLTILNQDKITPIKNTMLLLKPLPLTHGERQPCHNPYMHNNIALILFLNSGFTLEQLIEVAPHLNVLLHVLEPMHQLQPLDDYSAPPTKLTFLLREGFTRLQLIQILKHVDGPNPFKALLQALIPLLDSEEQALFNACGIPHTHLTLLLSEGFVAEQILQVLNHPQGANHLKTLLQLLDPAKEQVIEYDPPSTILSVLRESGMTLEHILDRLNHEEPLELIPNATRKTRLPEATEDSQDLLASASNLPCVGDKRKSSSANEPAKRVCRHHFFSSNGCLHQKIDSDTLSYPQRTLM